MCSCTKYSSFKNLLRRRNLCEKHHPRKRALSGTWISCWTEAAETAQLAVLCWRRRPQQQELPRSTSPLSHLLLLRCYPSHPSLWPPWAEPPMGFLRRIASILGFLHGAAADGDGDEDDNPAAEKGEAQPPPSAARRGFSLQVPVATTRPHAGPVLAPCNLGEGGVQVSRRVTDAASAQRVWRKKRTELGGAERGGRRGSNWLGFHPGDSTPLKEKTRKLLSKLSSNLY
ncbi:hypothetical protein Taro_023935 [Colocasia esculenta]|uniref:Uncharacterized protein n=1 Tax=Colocasia esculenta TaxID=4460 RepID=A0A843VCY0_COLES|nr:hypothetical protein [Colocasia esculenta]